MLLSVGLGGALGALSRYLISLWVTGTFGQSGWVAILSVNVAGSMMMGMMAALLAVSSVLSDPVRGFAMIGFLGALTTFSSFALNAGTLLHTQWLGMVMLCVGLPLCLSLGSFALCYWLVSMPS